MHQYNAIPRTIPHKAQEEEEEDAEGGADEVYEFDPYALTGTHLPHTLSGAHLHH